MSDRPVMRIVSSASRSAVVFAAVAAVVFLSSVGVGVRLLAGTLVAIGGNSNPSSASMIQELGGDPRVLGVYPGSVGVAGQGYLDPANPDSPYYGYDFHAVPWPSQIPYTSGWDGTTSFEQSQRQGLVNLQDVLGQARETDGPVAVAGYSSGANVVVREMRYLQSIGSPDADRLEFLLFASMNRPNGGIAQRFPGLFVPFFGVRFDGSTPTDTPYKTTDVSWEYDPISDFPNYPLNFLADLNALIGFGLLHANYFPADMDGPRAVADYTDPTRNITYVTLAAPELPLVAGLKLLGVPKQLRDLVEPALKVLVDLGYDRSINPGVPTPASLSPTPRRLLALPFQLLDAIRVGIQHALNPSWDKAPTVSDPVSDMTTLAAAAAVPQPKTGAPTARIAPDAAPKGTIADTAKTATGKDNSADDTTPTAGAEEPAGDQTAGSATPGTVPRTKTAKDPDLSADSDQSSASGSDDAPSSRRHPVGTPRTATPTTDSTKLKRPPATPDSETSDAIPSAGGGKHSAADNGDKTGGDFRSEEKAA